LVTWSTVTGLANDGEQTGNCRLPALRFGVLARLRTFRVIGHQSTVGRDESGRIPLRHQHAAAGVVSNSGTPSQRTAITGVPQASASSTTFGMPSRIEGSTSVSVPPGLVRLHRRCRTGDEAFASRGLSIHATEQDITLFASVPLTDEAWEPLAEGEVIAVREGRIVATREATDGYRSSTSDS